MAELPKDLIAPSAPALPADLVAPSGLPSDLVAPAGAQTAPEAPEPGIVASGLEGLEAAGSGFKQSFSAVKAAAGFGEGVAPPPPAPSQTSHGVQSWTDFLRPSKVAYSAAESSPEIAGGAIGSRLGPAGLFGVPAIVNMAKTLGPFYYDEIRAGKAPDEAFKTALKKSSISGLTTGASFLAFEFAPFAGAVKNLLGQAFVVQPAIAIAGSKATEAATGQEQPSAWEQYKTTAAGTVIPAAAAKGITKGIRIAKAGGGVAGEVAAHVSKHAPEMGLRESIKDSFLTVFNPKARSVEAEQAASLSRAAMGESYHRKAQDQLLASAALKETASLTPEQQLSFIDAFETKQAQTTPALQGLADAAHDRLSDYWNKIVKAGEKEGKEYKTRYADEYFQEFFPHFWKEPEKARAFFADRIKDLKPDGRFLKGREYALMKDGIKAGLEPQTTNPGELLLLKFNQYDKFLLKKQIWQDMKDKGLLRFVKEGEKPPEAPWAKVGDRAGEVFRPTPEGQVKVGHYYTPATVDTILQRVTEKGWFGSQPWYKTAMSAENMMNSMQLVGPFHAKFVTQDTMLSAISLGMQEMASGARELNPRRIAKGALRTATSPGAVGRAYFLGRKLRKEYLRPEFREWRQEPVSPFSKGLDAVEKSFGMADAPDMKDMLAHFQAAGGRFDLHESVAIQQWNKAASWTDFWKQATGKERLAPEGGMAREARLRVEAASSMMAGLARWITSPLMENIIPNVKAGVWYDMMRSSLEREPHLTKEQVFGRAQEHWDAIEDRLGELNYDLTFMPKTMVQGAWLAVRSTGWKYGTARIGIGGLFDFYQQGQKLGGRNFGDVRLTDRMAYLLAMGVGLAAQGAVYQYLKTGQLPQSLKDYYLPRTGEYDEKGEEVRDISTSYLRDFLGWSYDPAHEAWASASPLLHVIAEYGANKDWQGAVIHTPPIPGMEEDFNAKLAGAVSRRLEDLEYFAGQLVPIGVKQAKEAKKRPASGKGGLAGDIAGFFYGPAATHARRDEQQEESLQYRLQRQGIKRKARREFE